MGDCRRHDHVPRRNVNVALEKAARLRPRCCCRRHESRHDPHAGPRLHRSLHDALALAGRDPRCVSPRAKFAGFRCGGRRGDPRDYFGNASTRKARKTRTFGGRCLRVGYTAYTAFRRPHWSASYAERTTSSFWVATLSSTTHRGSMATPPPCSTTRCNTWGSVDATSPETRTLKRSAAFSNSQIASLR